MRDKGLMSVVPFRRNDAEPRAPLFHFPVRLRTVALPAEHGGWGFAIEPVVLGLIVAPSLAGLLFAIATLAAFLARHPLKLALNDLRRRRRYPRTTAAVVFAAIYAVAASAAVAAAVALASPLLLLPVAIALPFGAIQLFFDIRNESRQLAPELAGPIAITSSVASIAIAAGASIEVALALWTLMILRSIPTVLYVRARLRVDRSRPGNRYPAIAAHAVAVGAALLLLDAGFASLLAVAALVILLGRAALGLSAWRASISPKALGFREVGYGAVVVLAFAFGHLFGL